MPLPLSSGSFGNLKQKIHLKSSCDRYDPFGLNLLKSILFLVVGFTLLVLVTDDELVLVVFPWVFGVARVD
jgi:hypothetical protein